MKEDYMPLVWLLCDDRPGHRTQVIGLARHLRWPAREIPLEFNMMNWLPNPILGPRVLGLRAGSRSKLEPPYPDLVIGMGRRIVPVARWIKRQSGGRTRIVMLGRKAVGHQGDIDLLVSCAHFGQLTRANTFELVVPPTQVNAESLAAARCSRPDPMSGLRSPRVVFLMGGPTSQHMLHPHWALQLVTQIANAAQELGGDLAIVTSRRTPPTVVQEMRTALPWVHLHEWQRQARDNPYLSYLAHADILVVTGESESMIAEGSATGLPLTICPLEPILPGLKARIARAIRGHADGAGLLAGLCQRLLKGGWIVPPRDVALMHKAMQDRRMAAIFKGELNSAPPRYSNEIDTLAARIAALAEAPIQ